MPEIKLIFKNYKKLKNKEIDLADNYIYFISGSNDKGKSSFLQAIKALHTAKLDIDQPVTIGEENGSIEAINLVGADGKRYIVRATFDKSGDAKFVAIDEEGKIVKSVNQIRNIFKYNTFTAEEFMQMSMSAKGKEEAKKIFLSLLDEEQAKAYELSTLLEKQYYDKRTNLNATVKQLTEIEKGYELTDDQMYLISVRQVNFDKLKELEEEYSGIAVAIEKQKGIAEKIAHADKSIETNISDIAKSEQQIKQLQDHIKILNKATEELNKSREELVKLQTSDVPNADVLKQRIQTGKEKIAEIDALVLRKKSYDEVKAKRVVNHDEWEKTDAAVQLERDKQDDIIKNSKNPVKDLRLTDDGLMLGELSFKENQVCKSKAILTGARIQCAINDSPLIVIGCANDLDNESLKEMEAIAKEYGKTMLMDFVEREESELKVVAYDQSK